MTENNENLNEFLSKFFDETQAAQTEEDIRQGDRILDSFPTPQPHPHLLDSIKANIRLQLKLRKIQTRYMIIQRVAFAAMLVVIALVGVKFIATDSPPATAPDRTAMSIRADETGDDFFNGDSQLALMNDEMAQFETDMLDIQLDADFENGAQTLELETELFNINNNLNGDFWKG